MNFARLVISSVAATIAYFLFGGMVFTIGPLRSEFQRYPLLYRPMEDMRPLMTIGLLSMFVGILILTTLFAMTSRRGAWEGTQFGALIGIFAVCAFVFHNYVNLNIGVRLTLMQAIAYFVEWVIVGLVIGLIYKPKPTT